MDTYRSDSFGITKENPKLQNGNASDPSNGEQADPFYASSCTKANSRGSEPKPPRWLEGLLRAQFMLVLEARPRKCSECGEDD